MLWRKLFACLLAVTFPSVECAHAQPDDDTLTAIQEVTSELKVCSAYYGIAARCLIRQEPQVSHSYAKSSAYLENLARKGELSRDVSSNTFKVQSRIFSSVLLSAAHNSCENLPLLTTPYGTFCQRLERDVDARVKEWVECAREDQIECGGPELP